MAADIDVDGDAIEASARAVGDRAYAGTNNGTIAAQAAAGTLARLRTWVDPFRATPQTGYLVGGRREDPKEWWHAALSAGEHRTLRTGVLYFDDDESLHLHGRGRRMRDEPRLVGPGVVMA